VTAITCSLVDSGLGAPQLSWAQHCLDGLLMVGVPVAAAAIMQHTGRSNGTSRLACELTRTPSSSKPGTSCSSHTHTGQQQQKPAHSSAEAEAGSSCPAASSPAVPPAASPTPQVRHGSLHQGPGGTAGPGEGVGDPKGVPSHAVATTGPPTRAAVGTAATLQPAAPQPSTPLSGGSARPAAPQQQQQQHVLPALVASSGPEGFRELPPQFWYTAVTRVMPVNFKVWCEGTGGCGVRSMRCVLPSTPILSQPVNTAGQRNDKPHHVPSHIIHCAVYAAPHLTTPQAHSMSCLHLPTAQHAMSLLCLIA
jgi:hypothetical protein